MSFNFPNSPTEGTTFSPVGGYQYVYTDGKWRVIENPQVRGTAEARNRIINGAMQISQELAKDTPTTVSGAYLADQWQAVSGGAITYTGALQSTGADGPRIYFTATKASLATTDYLFFQQSIEASRVADFFWGQSFAKPVILRFEVYSATSAIGTASIRNAAGNRSFIAPFTVVPNQWTTITIPIPADTTGTWVMSGTAVSMSLCICFACGNGQTAPANGWQAGNFISAPSATNGIASGATYMLKNVGLYLDASATGLAPAWQMPDEAQELAACRRYYARVTRPVTCGYNSAGAYIVGNNSHPVSMRIAPAITYSSVAYTNTSGLTFNYATTDTNSLTVTITGAGQGFVNYDYSANARM